MTRIERLVTFRLLSRISVVVVVFFGLIILVESLDSWRFTYLSREQGTQFALLAVFGAAAQWSIKVLPITVLLGAIIGLLDLQQHRELVVAKSAGVSIWRLMRGPVMALLAIGIVVSVFADSWVTQINRTVLPVPRTHETKVGGPGQIWLEQPGPDGRYVVQGTRSGHSELAMTDVTFFLGSGQNVRRALAKRAQLGKAEWILEDVILLRSNSFPERVPTYTVPTFSTRAEIDLRLTISDEFTLMELAAIMKEGIRDPIAATAAAMRYFKLITLPMLLVGSLLIAFAFTAGYRRSGSYSGTVLYGIVLGFVVFVITEMAGRAGAAGVLNPAFAAWGPAIVAGVAGVTILLHKEDGRA